MAAWLTIVHMPITRLHGESAYANPKYGNHAGRTPEIGMGCTLHKGKAFGCERYGLSVAARLHDGASVLARGSKPCINYPPGLSGANRGSKYEYEYAYEYYYE